MEASDETCTFCPLSRLGPASGHGKGLLVQARLLEKSSNAYAFCDGTCVDALPLDEVLVSQLW